MNGTKLNERVAHVERMHQAVLKNNDNSVE
jgi:hypothetical protein